MDDEDRDHQKPAKGESESAPITDERGIDLSEGQRGVDVRPTSDPSAVNLPSMGGLAPVEAAPPDDQGGGDGEPSGEPSAGSGGDSEE